jgi:hypothetical protein
MSNSSGFSIYNPNGDLAYNQLTLTTPPDSNQSSNVLVSTFSGGCIEIPACSSYTVIEPLVCSLSGPPGNSEAPLQIINTGWYNIIGHVTMKNGSSSGIRSVKLTSSTAPDCGKLTVVTVAPSEDCEAHLVVTVSATAFLPAGSILGLSVSQNSCGSIHVNAADLTVTKQLS